MSTFENRRGRHAVESLRTAPNAVQDLWPARVFTTDLDPVASLLSSVRLSAGQMLNFADEPASHVYLVEAGAVAVSIPLPTGETTGVYIACPGDMLGLDALFAELPASANAVALTAGAARRVAVAALAKACRDRPELTLALAASLARQARTLQIELACCRQHGVERRLARLLLELSQRLGIGDMPLTQEQLALSLGVQRTTVTSLATRLKASGAVTYTRGMVRIIDPGKLAAVSCKCSAG